MKLYGAVEPRLFTPNTRPLNKNSSRGFALCEWAKRTLTIDLLPHMEWIFQHALETDEETGGYLYKTIVTTMGRQNSKTVTIQVRSLWGLEEDDCKLALMTSARLDTARESFLAACNLADEGMSAGAYNKPRLAAGSESLTHINSHRLKIAAQTGAATRGLSCGVASADELREMTSWDAWAAISKTTTAAGNKAQRWCASTAGSDASIVLNHLREVALSGADPTTFIAEYSSPENAELDDPTALAMANPALGRLFDLDTLLADLHTDPPAVYRTERMNIRVQSMSTLIDMDAIAATTDPNMTLESSRGRWSAAVDVAPDGLHVTLAVAGLVGDRVAVELAGAWSDVPSARRELPALLDRIRPRTLTAPPGPCPAMLGDLLRKRPAFKVLSAADVSEAAGALVELIRSRQLRHAGDPLLVSHLAGVSANYAANGSLTFVRTGGHCDSAVAASCAVLGARSAPAPISLRVVSAEQAAS